MWVGRIRVREEHTKIDTQTQDMEDTGGQGTKGNHKEETKLQYIMFSSLTLCFVHSFSDWSLLPL